MIAGMTRRHATVMLALGLAAAGAVLVHAQQIWVGGGEFSNAAPRFAKAGDFDGSFLYCRGFFGGRFGRENARPPGSRFTPTGGGAPAQCRGLTSEV